MPISRNRAALGAAAVLLAGAAWLPAIGQDRPESILPPGFGEPAPTPVPARTPVPSAPRAPAPAPTTAPGTVQALPPGYVPSDVAPTPLPTPSASPTPVDPFAYELPPSARRSLAAVGAVDAGSVGLSGRAFGTAGGRGLSILMRRLDAPVPSRWLSIALRRALIAQVATPGGINGADFAADRAWLLLRMGESDGARAVVQSVDTPDYTPRLYQVAMQAMLANGDPAGLCPLVDGALSVSREAAWRFARGMCTALAGNPQAARAQLQALRRGRGRTIDTLLAEKVAGAAASGAITIEWDAVDRLTAWRYGLATATGVEMPSALLAGLRPWVAGWRATEPMLAAPVRAGLSDWAASQGVLSNAALVDLFSEVESADDASSASVALARDLRSAYAEGDAAARARTLRGIWDGAMGDRARYARLVLTARAAAALPPAEALESDAPRLIAAMLTAGLDTQAAEWGRIVPTGSEGWALLAAAEPTGRRWSAGDVEGFAGTSRAKARMLLAGLAGLGRMSEGDIESAAQALDVRLGLETSWTRAIGAAAARRDAGTVLLLMAVGMQTPNWSGVPAETIFHGCAALRAVGLDGEARMIAAEAVARS